MLTSREKLSAAYPSRSSWALKTKEKQGHLSSAARLMDAPQNVNAPVRLHSCRLSADKAAERWERKQGTVTGRCVCVWGGGMRNSGGVGGEKYNRCGYFIIN